MREMDKFSKQRIEQIDIIPEGNVIIVLSNSYVHMYDSRSLDLKETLGKSKGVSCLAILTGQERATEDNDTNHTEGKHGQYRTSSMAVAVKRRILVWNWVDSALEPEPKEIVLASGVKSLTWINQKRLVAGLGSNYVIVDIDGGAVTDVVGPGSIGGAPGQDGGRFGGAGVAGMGYLGMTAPPPLATSLGNDEIFLAKDINTHFIDSNGESLGRRQIPWANAPEAIGFFHPYLLALQTGKGTLDIRNPQTLSQLQLIPLQSANRLSLPRSSVDWIHPAQGFFIYSDRALWLLKMEGCSAQIDELVEQGQLDEAISLAEMFGPSQLDDKEARLKEVKTLKAQILFDQHQFRESIDLFTEVSAPPERVISMYPPFIAGSASADSSSQAESGAEGQSNKRPSSLSESSMIGSIGGWLHQGNTSKPSAKGAHGDRRSGQHTRNADPLG